MGLPRQRQDDRLVMAKRYFCIVNRTDMNREEIHSVIAGLARSKGFYGRLMAGIYGDYDSILDWLANDVKPTDELDIILALEE